MLLRCAFAPRIALRALPQITFIMGQYWMPIPGQCSMLNDSLANGMLAAQVSNRHATFLFPQYPDNLFFVKSALLHRLLLKNGIRLYSFLDQFAGLRSPGILLKNSNSDLSNSHRLG
jgi:hypothetical protein